MNIENLSFSYGSLSIFRDFNFHSDSRIVLVKGPTGCGKTTLLKLISRNLLPDKCTRIDYAQSCSLIIQEDSLLPWLTGIDNIRKLTGIQDDRILGHPLYHLVEPFCDKRAFEMSYGQRRLVELVRVFLFSPELICLDEPFNFLDNRSREFIVKYLVSYSSSGPRIFLSTHELDDIRQLKVESFKFAGRFPISELANE